MHYASPKNYWECTYQIGAVMGLNLCYFAALQVPYSDWSICHSTSVAILVAYQYQGLPKLIFVESKLLIKNSTTGF